MLVSGLLTDFIRLRAAMKLRGMARIVPRVVASNARNTVSMILFHVSRAVWVNIGVPTFRRMVTRINCASSLGRLGSLIPTEKLPSASVVAVSLPSSTTLVGSLPGTKRTGPLELGTNLKPSTVTISPGSAHDGVTVTYGPDVSGASTIPPSAGQVT